MRAARRKPLFGTTQLVLLLAAGCSLQNFDYLQQSSGGSSAGGTSGSAGSSTGGTETNGGEPSTAGTGNSTNGGGTTSGSGSGAAAGSEDTGGSGGSTSGGSGGKGGSGGNGGSGATGQIVNPSFETATTVGWTVEPPSALVTPEPRYAFVQYKSAGLPDGMHEYSTWHMTEEFTVDLFQTIKGLEDGVYDLKAYVSLGETHNSVKLYAKDCGGPDPEPTPIVPPSDAGWYPIWVKGIEVTGGSCTIGLYISSKPQGWVNADLFTFERVSDIGAGGAGGQGQGGAN